MESGKRDVICVAQSRMRTARWEWEGRMYRTYRVRRVRGRTGGEFVAVQEESRYRKQVRIVTKFMGGERGMGGDRGRRRGHGARTVRMWKAV